MALNILFSRKQKSACFYNSVVDWAFGPVANGEDAETQLIVFADWLALRPENYEDCELEAEWWKFNAEFMPEFREWMADRWDEIDWNNVKDWVSQYRQAKEGNYIVNSLR